MIKNIVFDMGNVLLRFDRDAFMDAIGVADEDRRLLMNEVYLSLEWSRMDRGDLTEDQAAEIMCRNVPERLWHQVHLLADQWDRPIIPVEGMADLVKELKEKGYGIYLLSNASYRQHDYWPRVPGHEYFDDTLISADVKLVKPQPEIYRLMLEKFKLRAEECVFIDDNTANCEGAHYVGIPTIVFHDDAGELRRKLKALGVDVNV